MVKSLLVVHPHDYMAAWELQLATIAQYGERVQHIASLRKNQNSKFTIMKISRREVIRKQSSQAIPPNRETLEKN